MVNSKPKTGDTLIPDHVKQAKDIYMTKLGNLGAYTWFDNIRPRLSIAPPRIEEPDIGTSEDDNDPIDFDPCNVCPTPISPALGHHSKRSKDASKHQRQQPLLRHGRDVLPTRDKSTTGNVALRFWALVSG